MKGAGLDFSLNSNLTRREEKTNEFTRSTHTKTYMPSTKTKKQRGNKVIHTNTTAVTATARGRTTPLSELIVQLPKATDIHSQRRSEE
eukprot:scaffold2557_cov121-Cylindrotheca_fusiformis.AAC.10